MQLELAFVLPSCYAKQADRYVSLELKGKVWVTAVIFLSLRCIDSI